jgi:negative regulator of flagellin synthesis FlgM
MWRYLFMKITGNSYEISRYIGKKVLSPGKEDSEKTSAQINIPPESTGGDAVVNLSEASKEVQRAREVIESEPDVRLEKVRAVQEEIERGVYEVDAEKTADKMLGYFIEEMV